MLPMKPVCDFCCRADHSDVLPCHVFHHLDWQFPTAGFVTLDFAINYFDQYEHGEIGRIAQDNSQ